MGSVFDESFLDVTAAEAAARRRPRAPVCRTCNLDPINVLTDELRARDEGEHASATPR